MPETGMEQSAVDAALSSTAFGVGALQSPPDERDFVLADLLTGYNHELEVWKPPAAGHINGIPHLNQHNTPMCVAFSSSALKSWQDHKESLKYYNFDESLFFRQIGGGPSGAFLRSALDRMLKVGYPVAATGHAEQHKIKAYYRVDRSVAAAKLAIHTYGPIILATPWYNSWFAPDKRTFVLPRADYSVGGHAIVACGWNNLRGLRLHNSWGTGWGKGGDCYMPYSVFEHSVWEVWKTVDASKTAKLDFVEGDEAEKPE